MKFRSFAFNIRVIRHVDARSLTQDEANTLKQWISKQFGDKVKNVKVDFSLLLLFHIFYSFRTDVDQHQT